MKTILKGNKKAALTEYHQIEALLALHSFLKFDTAPPALRDWAVSPDFALLIVQSLIKRRPNHVLECGSGASTIFIAKALRRLGGGTLLSLEHDPHHAERIRLSVLEHGLEDVAQVVSAPLKKYKIDSQVYFWYDIDRVPPQKNIDVLVVDGPPDVEGEGQRYPAIPLLSESLAKNALILLDDAKRELRNSTVNKWKQAGFLFEDEYVDTEKGALIITMMDRRKC